MNILVCDDDQALREVIELTLIPRGHAVDSAGDTKSAIAIFEAKAAAGITYDLIVTDIYMQGSTGFYLASYLRNIGYTGRLAVMTAGKPEYSNMAMVQAEYWPKPDVGSSLIDYVEGRLPRPVDKPPTKEQST